MYWISPDGQYHEGDAQPGDVMVTQRPQGYDIYNNGIWSQSAEAQNATIFQNNLNLGFTNSFGWVLPLDEGTRNLITSGAALINSVIAGYQLTGNTTALNNFLASSYVFTDNIGNKQTVTIQQALNINIAYGQYYQQIWAAAQ